MSEDIRPAVPQAGQAGGRSNHRLAVLLGPAFVAAIAYVDPGNVAANVSAGSRYGFLLVWILVMASAMAMLIQYQSAKVGIVTGKSLPALLGERLTPRGRIAFWAQAEIVAGATDLAEVVGGAIALRLLFGLPLIVGGIIVGAVSMAMLTLQTRQHQRRFEAAIGALLLIIVIGFLTGLVINPPAPGDVLGGLVPRFDGGTSILLAASMLGATVMPHVIYLHSALIVDRFGTRSDPPRIRRLLRATRWDVLIALFIAGAVNVALLLLAAENLRGKPGTDSIAGAQHVVRDVMGPAVATVFAVGLLASGLASTSVGCYAGSVIMEGLLGKRIPVLARRSVTMIPALVVLGFGVNPTQALVISQVVLSFGIPFAVIPLRRIASDRSLLGEHVDGPWLRWATFVVATIIIGLNVLLIWLTVTGR